MAGGIEHMFDMGKAIYDWSEIQRFYDAGASEAETRKHFRLFPATFSKAVKYGRLILRPEDANRLRVGPGNSKYDWAAIQRYHDAGYGFRACKARFGFWSQAWYKAIERGELRARRTAPGPQLRPVEDVLHSRSRLTIKRNLLKLGILENRCEECDLSEWRGKPLSIQIDHRNGIRDDHRLENLRMLCPNCHSQTETFAARNGRKPIPASPSGKAEDSDSSIPVVRIHPREPHGPIV